MTVFATLCFQTSFMYCIERVLQFSSDHFCMGDELNEYDIDMVGDKIVANQT